MIELAGPGGRTIEVAVLASWDFRGERSKRSVGRRSAAGLTEYLRRSRSAETH